MPKIIIRQSLRQDAWNWWHGCNTISYGINWGNRIGRNLQKKIINKKQKETLAFLTPYLKKIYKQKTLSQQKKEIQAIFDDSQNGIFNKMEQVTKRKIYRDDFICILTTFPRAPYRYPHGYVWIPVVWPEETYIRTFIHELLHFQTYAYWQDKCLNYLTKKDFENLKEALTVVLNEEFKSFLAWPDKGYLIHKDLRKKLLNFWQGNKNFDELIDYGIEIYPEFRKQHGG